MTSLGGTTHAARARRAVADWYAALSAMDDDAWLNTYAEAVHVDDAERPAGRSDLGALFGRLWEPFELLSVRERQIFRCGSRLAVAWSGHGLLVDGPTVPLEGIDTFGFDPDGRIISLRRYRESLTNLLDLS